jgi:hypothetical protein
MERQSSLLVQTKTKSLPAGLVPQRPSKPKTSNALNQLMSSREEKMAWDAVDVAETARREAKFAKPDAKGKSKAKGQGNATGAGRQRRPAPFYKVIYACLWIVISETKLKLQVLPGMPIAVDAFCYGKVPDVAAYFLSCATK